MKGGRAKKGKFGLFERLWLQAKTALAGCLLFPVLPDPGFPAFASGWITTREGERRYIGIRNFLSQVGILRKDSHEGGDERLTRDAIKDVTLYLLAIFGG